METDMDSCVFDFMNEIDERIEASHTTTESLHAERVSPAHPSAQGEWKPDWVNNYGRTYGKVEIQNKNYAN